ncbi:MAG: SLBB domain-containing protein [Chloroflexi bacterium]|nr:SLBB domain-containing protein [Chloroflexota bacterium]
MKFDEIVAHARSERERHRRKAIPTIQVATGECGRAAGAPRVLDAIRSEVNRRSIQAEVVETGCNGMCYQAVLVEVESPDAPRVTYGRITPDKVPELMENALVSGKVARDYAIAVWADRAYEGVPPIGSLPFFQGQRRLISSNFGMVDPHEISDYINRGGYQALAKALLTMKPEQVIDEIKRSKLTGRGGAYFPSGLKLEGCRAAKGFPKYLVVNAEEGEPGVFKDRHIMEGDPHLLVEGAVIAAYAIGAEAGYIYINGEAEPSIERMRRALGQAAELNLVGRNILESGFSFLPEIRLGAGGYVLGEASTMHNSIEGQRPLPRVKLKRSVESGVFDRPTVTNNVETLSNFPAIISKGGNWYTAIGSQKSTGTKLLALSGNLARPGLLEVPMGLPLREVVEGMCGGAPNGRRLKAVLTGGPSGGVIPEALLDTPFEAGALEQQGSILGSGGVVAIDDRNCVVDLVRLLTSYNQQESCGECTPCREGTMRMRNAMDRIVIGEGSAGDIEDLLYLCELLGPASLCGLGQASLNPIASSLRHFGQEYHEHIANKRCPTGICSMGQGGHVC